MVLAKASPKDSETEDEQSSAETIEDKRYIRLSYIILADNWIVFWVDAQSHRGDNFVPEDMMASGQCFEGLNGDKMMSMDAPELSFNEEPMTFYVRGNETSADLKPIVCNASEFERIQTLVKAYNEAYGSHTSTDLKVQVVD